MIKEFGHSIGRRFHEVEATGTETALVARVSLPHALFSFLGLTV